MSEITFSSRLWQKVKRDPSVPIGLCSMLAVIGYGIYGYRRRKGISTSLYILHYRVFAQGAVISAMTLGVCYSMGKTLYHRHYLKDEENSIKKSSRQDD